jgi:hypothetical protein
MTLALLEQELDDIDIQLGRLWQAHSIWSWRTWCGLPDPERWAIANRNDLSDGRIPIEHSDRLAAPDCPQVLAQPGF